MERYRIVQGEGYDGCIPITVYWVQVLKRGFWGYKWENIKGFDGHEKRKGSFGGFGRLKKK